MTDAVSIWLRFANIAARHVASEDWCSPGVGDADAGNSRAVRGRTALDRAVAGVADLARRITSTVHRQIGQYAFGGPFFRLCPVPDGGPVSLLWVGRCDDAPSVRPASRAVPAIVACALPAAATTPGRHRGDVRAVRGQQHRRRCRVNTSPIMSSSASPSPPTAPKVSPTDTAHRGSRLDGPRRVRGSSSAAT